MAWASAHMKELGAHWTRSNLQVGYSYERLADGRRFSLLWSEGGAQNVPVRVTGGASGVRVTSLIPDRFGAVLFEEDVPAAGGVAVVTVRDDPLLVMER